MGTEVKYINLRDGKILFTFDNWKTIQYREDGHIEGSLETDRNNVSEAKIRFKLGNKYGHYIIDELKKIEKQFKLSGNNGYGEAFEIFAMSVILNDEFEKVYNDNIVKGSNDGKIDAVVFEDDEIKLYQIKIDYTENYSKIKPTMKKNYNKYLDDRELKEDSLSDINDFFSTNDSKIRDGLKLKTFTICSNEEADISPMDIFNKHIDNLFLNKTNEISIDLRADERSGYAKIGDTDQVFAYFISAKKFLDNLMKNKAINNNINNLNKLFYDNVRGQLKKNEEMFETIKSDARNFVLYNNGITITGDIEKNEGTNTFKVTEPVISNGQQTLWNLIKNRDSENISKINILVIIKNTNQSSQTKSNISRYTNSQTNIKPIDLLSLNYFVRNIQSKISAELYNGNKYFLNINSSGNRGFEKELPKIFEKTNIIKLIDFCKLYYSVSDKSKLGSWKNNVSNMIYSKLGSVKEFDLNKSLKICSIISGYNNYLKNIKDKEEKNMLSSAGLAMMYISYIYDYDFDKSKKIINKINDKYFYKATPKPSKLIDIYKSDEIIKKIEEFV